MKSDGRTDAVISGVYTEKSHSEEKKKTAFLEFFYQLFVE
jgi:hypothetical protein